MGWSNNSGPAFVFIRKIQVQREHKQVDSENKDTETYEHVCACTTQADAAINEDEEQAWGPAALAIERQARREHLDRLAQSRDTWIRRNKYFYDKVKRLLRFIIEPQKKVLNIRCQAGHLLAAVDPSRGVGVEISEGMIEVARKAHPEFEYVQSDSEDYQPTEKFDYIFFNDISDTIDLLGSFAR